MLRRKIGDFYLTGLLSSGGRGGVYLALNPRTGEKRAIELLAADAGSADGAYTRFARGVDIVRGLRHPRIVSVLHCGRIDDFFYYSMEYFPGGDLSRRLCGRRVSPGEALSLLVPVCDA